MYRISNGNKARLWEIFRKYHYLNTDLHQAATQYIGILNDEVVVCHTGVLQAAMKKGRKRVHRFVTLPEYQGIGIGVHFINFIAGLYKAKGLEFNLITTTPALRFALEKSDKWELKRSGYVQQAGNLKDLSSERYNMKHIIKSFSCNRITYSFDYIGEETKSAEIESVQAVTKKHKQDNVQQLTLF